MKTEYLQNADHSLSEVVNARGLLPQTLDILREADDLTMNTLTEAPNDKAKGSFTLARIRVLLGYNTEGLYSQSLSILFLYDPTHSFNK